MPVWQWLTVAAVALVALYAAAVVALVVSGRRSDARALVGFIPDCIVLFKRLLVDRRVGRRQRALLGALVVYLAMPVDVVPDFIPVAGQLDDVILVALVLRTVLRGAGDALVHEHWPGPARSLAVIRRLAFGQAA